MTTQRIIVVATACLALASCASVPDSGPVRAGNAEVEQSSAFLPILEGPEAGSPPRAIVQDFINAAAGGSVIGFDVARDFLTADASAQWDPLAEVTIYDSRAVVPSFDEVSGTFIFTVPVAGQLDASGVLTEAPPDVTRALEYSVAADEFGEYRVASLEDGIVMPAANFTSFYRPVQLFFASRDGSTMVPELRWFPNNDQIATAVARELIEGPSVWLADAVVTGFPPGAALAVDAVVVADGVATVGLAPGSAGTAAQRSLASEQLRLTLTSLADVQEVVATVGNLPLDGDGSANLAEAPLPPEQAAVVANGRLGYWDGQAVTVTPAEVGVAPEGAFGLALAYDLSSVAMVVDGDVVLSTALADSAALEAPVAPEEDDDPAELATSVALEGDALVAPSYDASGWLWSAESNSEGVVLATQGDGEPVDLAASWLAGRTIQALSVSRDGSRVAILSRAAGEQVLEVMSIVRDEDGRPISLGQPLALDPTLASASDVVWVDAVSLAVLGEAAGDVSLVTVGGWTVPVASVPGAVAITARNGARTLLGVDEAGILIAGSGARWTPKASGVTDVAFAG